MSKGRHLKESLFLEILSFLDINSLQKARFVSKKINHLIVENLNEFNAKIEIVQLRCNNGIFSCKCLPYKEKSQEDKFEDINKAIQYLQERMHKTSIRLLNIHYIDLNNQTLDLLGILSVGLISDVSITGCNFQNTDPQKFRDVFIEGNLKAERYTISYSKNVSSQMFDDNFLDSLLGKSIKMMTLHFCSFIESDQTYLTMSCEKIMEWLFDGQNSLDYRVLSIADLKLDKKFAERLIETFQQTEDIKPTTIVISGKVEQTIPVDSQFSTGPMPERRVKHKSGKFFFKFGRISPDRIEFSLLKLSDENSSVDTKRARRSMKHDYPPKA